MNLKGRSMNRMALILCVVIGLVFTNALAGGFVWVDHKEIVQEAFVLDSWADLRAAWTGSVTDLERNQQGGDGPTSGYYRPVQLLYVTAMVRLFGHDATLHHIPNIVLHMLSSLLLMVVIWKLTGDTALAGLAALLFGVHPIHTENVTWISGSKDTLSGVFFFAALALYVAWSGLGRRVPKSESAGGGTMQAGTVVGGGSHIGSRRLLLFGGSLLCYLLGLLTKEAVIVLPGVLVLVELCFAKRRAGEWLRRIVGLAGLGLSSLAYLVLRSQVLGGLGDKSVWRGDKPVWQWHGDGPAETALTMGAVLAEYVGKLLLPLGLTTADTTRIVGSVSDPAFLAGLSALFLLLVLLGCGLARRSRAVVALGVGWFLIALLPVSNLLPLHHIKAERFLYLPSAGFLLMLAGGGIWWIRGCLDVGDVGKGNTHARTSARTTRLRRWSGIFAAGLYLVLLAGITWDRNRDWVDDATLFGGDVARTPNYREGLTWLGITGLERGENKTAYRCLVAAAREDRRYTSFVNYLGLYDNMGRALLGLGRPAEAARCFERALTQASWEPLLHMNLGMALGSSGRIDEALESYSRAEALAPRNHLVPFNRAVTLDKAGRVEPAMADLRRALRIAPEHLGSLNLLGVLLQRQRDFKGAKACFRRSLAIDPSQGAIVELLRSLLNSRGE